MKSLFLKIFVSFWLSTALIFVVSIVMSERTRGKMNQERFSAAVLYGSQALLGAYEEHGCAGLLSNENALSRLYEIRILVLEENGDVLCAPGAAPVHFGAIPPPGTVDFRTLNSGSRYTKRIAVTRVSHKGHDYIAMAEGYEISGHMILHWELLKHFVLAIGISGLTCLSLARYLASPISRIRSAARRIAAGQLDARAGAGCRVRQDEVGELLKDFDFMAEQLQLLLSAQRRLLSDVSHELRSPLTRLKLALELARCDPPEERARALDCIEKEADRVSDLIGRLLNLSRLETANSMSETSLFSLADLLREIVADAELEAKSRECRLESSLAGDLLVDGNSELLRSAFENVIRNALRYTAAGSAVRIAAECGVGEDSPNSPKVSIIVRDRGPGVPEKELENIFQPFYRLDASRERTTGGAGLGLAIAQRAVRLHRGQISASNANEGGLIVTVTLPLAPQT